MAVLRTEQDIINDAMAEMRVPILATTADWTLRVRETALREAVRLLGGYHPPGAYLKHDFPNLVLHLERYLVTGSFDDANAEPSPAAVAET